MKASNCGPLIARTSSKRPASSLAVCVFGPESRRTSQTPAAAKPTSTSTPSHALPSMEEDNHPHNTARTTAATTSPPHESLLLDLLDANGVPLNLPGRRKGASC